MARKKKGQQKQNNEGKPSQDTKPQQQGSGQAGGSGEQQQPSRPQQSQGSGQAGGSREQQQHSRPQQSQGSGQAGGSREQQPSRPQQSQGSGQAGGSGGQQQPSRPQQSQAEPSSSQAGSPEETWVTGGRRRGKQAGQETQSQPAQLAAKRADITEQTSALQIGGARKHVQAGQVQASGATQAWSGAQQIAAPSAQTSARPAAWGGRGVGRGSVQPAAAPGLQTRAPQAAGGRGVGRGVGQPGQITGPAAQAERPQFPGPQPEQQYRQVPAAVGPSGEGRQQVTAQPSGQTAQAAGSAWSQPGGAPHAQGRQPGGAPQAQGQQPGGAPKAQGQQPGGAPRPQEAQRQPVASGSQQETRATEEERTPANARDKLTPQEEKELTEITQKLSGTSLKLRTGGTQQREKAMVIVNYFPLDTKKLRKAFHYDIAIVPERPKRALPMAMEVLRLETFPNRFPAYDGNKNLYSSSPLFKGDEMVKTVSVQLDQDKKDYHISIKLVTELDLTCLHDCVEYARQTSVLDNNHPAAPLQCLNVILTNVPSMSYTRIGRSYFTPPAVEFRLGEGCVLYHGFSQAVMTRWKPFVNVDAANKAFTESKGMIDLLQEMFPRTNLKVGLPEWDAKRLAAYIKKLKIVYQVLPLKKTYIVNDLYLPATKAKFNTETGSITVDQYFRTTKQITLQYPNLPTLWVGNKDRQNRIWVPMECCTLLPGQPVTKNMTENQVRNMIREVSKDTNDRRRKIQQNVDSLNYNKNPVMREFGLTVDTKPQEVAARILNPPEVRYANKIQSVSKGQWTGDKFRQPARIESWTIMCLDNRTQEQALIELAKQLKAGGAQCGIQINNPEPPFMYLRDTRTELLKAFASHKFQLVVVVLSNRDDCYSEVKKASELTVGCLTQCVKPKTIRMPIQRATISNILLKINAKLNGFNHSIVAMPSCLSKPTLIMGADVTHPGATNFPSIAAVTASFDVCFFKYRFEWRLQPPRQEIIDDLKAITMTHLRYYREHNNTAPCQIFYIRDGVSDGQFLEVLRVELNAIRAACSQLSPTFKPAIVFVIVQKRHRTRFFPKDPSISEDRNFNVPAGTCVDTVITNPYIVDFFLVSHASIKGVARPTKYVKLWDDTDMSEDDLESAMYYLCHLYARCNRSVSYPAPTYYAHHAAARAKAYCDRNTTSDRLQQTQDSLQIHSTILQTRPMFYI